MYALCPFIVILCCYREFGSVRFGFHCNSWAVRGSRFAQFARQTVRAIWAVRGSQTPRLTASGSLRGHPALCHNVINCMIHTFIVTYYDIMASHYAMLYYDSIGYIMISHTHHICTEGWRDMDGDITLTECSVAVLVSTYCLRCRLRLDQRACCT